jgi:phosphohistidine phosphatase
MAAPPEASPMLDRILRTRRAVYRKTLARCRSRLTEEAVHDLRVASRRLISVLGMLPRTKRLRRQLRRRLKLLGPLRDLHVQIPAVRELLKTFPELRPLYEEMLARKERESRIRLEEGDLELRLARFRPAPTGLSMKALRSDLRRSVDDAFRRVLELRRRVDPADTTTIHRLRIGFKRFRYRLESFASVFHGPDLEPLRRFQRAMGQINDAEVLLGSMSGFARRRPHPRGRMGRAIHELMRRRARLIGTFMTMIDEIESLWVLEEDRPMLDLFLLRHAEAVERGTQGIESDEDRPLTPEGEADMRRSARGFKAMKISLDEVMTSPLRRAKETAEALCRAIGFAKEPRVTESLSPSADSRRLIDEIKGLARVRSVLLVGHEPALSRFASVLISGGPGVNLAMKKGGLCRLKVGTLSHGRCAQLRWLVTPRQLSRIE